MIPHGSPGLVTSRGGPGQVGTRSAQPLEPPPQAGEDPGEGLRLARRQVAEEELVHLPGVLDRGAPEGGPALVGEDGLEAPPVTGRRAAVDQAAGHERLHLVGDARRGEDHPGRQLSQPEPALGGLVEEQQQVGAGPAGIFACYEIIKKNPQLKIALIDKGNRIEKRKSSEIMFGFGGAGAFSDGKLHFTPKLSHERTFDIIIAGI